MKISFLTQSNSKLLSVQFIHFYFYSEFEKVRCEKRLLEDKYKSLKEKYLRLKNEVRLSMERKRQAKMNRQLQQRDPSTTEDTTDRSTDHSKPPLTRRYVSLWVSLLI